MDPKDVETVRMERPRSNGPRTDVLLGIACLVLAIACLVLAGTIAVSSRAILAKLSAAPIATNSSATPASPSDAQIRQAVVKELQEVSCCDSLRDGKVNVAVERGQITLSGEVPSTVDRTVAFSLARASNGVTQVQNNIVVRSVAAHPEESGATAQQTTVARDNDTHKTAVVRPTAAHRELTQDEREAQTWVDLGNKELNTTDSPNYDSAIQYFRLALAVDSKNVAARKGLARAEKAKQAEAAILGRHT